MSETTYRAGIVGLGFVGGADQVSGDALGQQVTQLDGTHLEAYLNHPRIDLVAGSSRDVGRRERFEQRTDARSYADWRELLEQEELDIVSVATYTPAHAEIAVACAERGVRAINCEKPMARTVPEAEQMLAACEKSGTLLTINHNRRFHANFRRLRDLIDDGGLGELTSVSLQWSAGRLGNVGSHAIDAVIMLTGRRVEAVSGTLDLAGKPDCRGPQFSDPGGWGIIRMTDGVMVTVDAKDYAACPNRMIVTGTAGRATIDRYVVDLEWWDGRVDEWPDLGREPSSMDRGADEIVAWLDDAAPFPYDAEEAAHTLETILAFHASHDRNAAWVELPLTGEDRERELNSG